jgi:predicted glycosyltransferase
VTYVSGGFDTVALDLGDADVLQLPPVRTADASFRTLVGEDGRTIDDDWRAQRKTALLDAFDAVDPDIVLIELFPFGRWPFRFELLPLLEAAHRRYDRPYVACSLRDILVPKTDPKRRAAIVEIVRRYFDAVLVHGDPSFVRLEETFAPAREIAELIQYTGYIASDQNRSAPPPVPGNEVIVSAGGGATGGQLLRTALAARPLSCMADRPWRILVGPNLPADDRATLVEAPGVTIETLRPDFRRLLSGCALSISQAGYNTVMDLLTCGPRSIVVPFSAHGQSEQAKRADLLAMRGCLHVLPETALTAETLAAKIDEAMAATPPARPKLDLGGAERSARFLANPARPRVEEGAPHGNQMSL